LSERDLPNGRPVTAREAEAAQRLAEALEGGEPAGVDRAALAAARLLQAMYPSADHLSRQRMRTELVRAAARTHTSVTVRRRILAAAAVVAVVVCAGILWRLAVPPTQNRVAERERAARSAVAAVAEWDVDASAAARLDSTFDRQWRNRLALKLERERASELSEQEAASGRSTENGNAKPGGAS
jgi:hypothetical protein